jgi:hypothetical protein
LPAIVVTNNESGVTLDNVTVAGTFTLPLPATVYAGGNTILVAPQNNNFYAGPSAGISNGTGGANTGVGGGSLQSNTNGTNNTGFGFATLGNNTNGSYNTASGERALADNTSGNDNTADGRHALMANTSGSDNTAIGYEALSSNPGGSNNIALGALAGNTFGANESSNIDIGNPGVGGDNNIIRIGSGQTSAFLAGVINGNGAGLTNLDASQLTSGTLPLSQLPSTVITNNERNVSLVNLTLTSNLNLPSLAIIYTGTNSLLYSDSNGNFYAGLVAGDFTNTASGNTGVGNGALYKTTGSENTAYGTSALSGNSGDYNTAVGGVALGNNTGTENTAVGFSAMQNNTGSYNTAEGYGTLYLSISGDYNTAVGYEALELNEFGSNNTAIGAYAMENNRYDNQIVAVGYEALANDNAAAYGIPSLTGNGENTAVGYYTLQSNVSGYGNTGVGYLALRLNSSGFYNTAMGDFAQEAGTGSYNTSVGVEALEFNTNGNNNTAIGTQALIFNTSGSNNVAVGSQALYGTVTGNTGSANTAIGESALNATSSGTNNIALGYQAGMVVTTGNNNIYIGNPGQSGESGGIRIGTTNTASGETLIAGIWGATLPGGQGTEVFVDAGGRLGTATSSRRFKEDIKSMAGTSEALYSLRPVTFKYKSAIDPKGFPQFGLIAEEVDKVDPDLVVRDDQHHIYTVRYEAVNAMLLNEFLKQHQKVEEQTAEIKTLKEKADKVESLEKQNDSLAARLNELEAAVKLLAERK